MVWRSGGLVGVVYRDRGVRGGDVDGWYLRSYLLCVSFAITLFLLREGCDPCDWRCCWDCIGGAYLFSHALPFFLLVLKSCHLNQNQGSS